MEPSRRSANVRRLQPGYPHWTCNRNLVETRNDRLTWLLLSVETFRPIQTPISDVHIGVHIPVVWGEANLAANLRILATLGGVTGLGTGSAHYQAPSCMESVV